MGHSHATTGAAAWVALTATVPGALGWVPMSKGEVIAGAVVTAGAALLPDADHHSGTIAHSLPPVSKVATRFVGQMSGGHRHGTHGLLAVPVFAAIAWALSFLRIPYGAGEEFQLGAWLLLVLMTAFAAKALRITRGWISSWAVSLGTATLTVVYAPETMWWLPMSVALGVLVHILGDLVTVQGVPLLWPLKPKPVVPSPFWKNGYFSVPVIGTAGSAREWVFIVAVDMYLIYVLGVTALGGAGEAMSALAARL